MKVIDKNKNKAVEVDSVSNNGEIYHVYDEGNKYRLFKDEVQVINQDTCIHEYEAYARQQLRYLKNQIIMGFATEK